MTNAPGHRGAQTLSTIRRKQLFIEPEFSATTRQKKETTSLNGSDVLRDSDNCQVTKLLPEQLRMEFQRLTAQGSGNAREGDCVTNV